MARALARLLLSGILILAVSPPTTADPSAVSESALVAQAALNYIPWYTPPASPWPNPWPTPIPSAYAAIDGAFAVGNIYDTGSLGFGHPGGFDMLITGM